MGALYEFWLAPFADYEFMRRALVACVALSVSAGPLGVFLVLRRMSLMGDAMGHAILPGVAIGYAVSGLSLLSMTMGGVAAGVVVALASAWTSRATGLKEDASLAGFYLTSLAVGVILISAKGSPVDLLHILFGSILAVDDQSLLFVVAVATVSVFTLAVMLRTLVLECFDPIFARSVGARGAWAHAVFVGLVVLNLVAAFQALGTLLAVGLMMLPALAARFWFDDITRIIVLATALAVLASVAGLLLSYHVELASGPSIILAASLIYLGSIVLGSNSGLLGKWLKRPHFHDPGDAK